MFELQSLSVRRGSLDMIREVSMKVNDGEIVSLMGTNGAGKTTLMRAISGIGHITGGKMFFDGEDITKASSDKIVEMGIVQIPEGRRLFSMMSVRENLEIGAHNARGRAHLSENLEYVYHLFPELEELSSVPAGNLSGGQQQMVAVGRGIMAEPRLLMLDEPSVGLSPMMTQRVFEAVKEIHAKGTAILISEQNLHDVMQIADRAYVLEQGRIRAEGTAEEIFTSDVIRKTYLGM